MIVFLHTNDSFRQVTGEILADCTRASCRSVLRSQNIIWLCPDAP